MFLTVVTLIASFGLASYFGFLLATFLSWPYAFISILLVAPTWALIFILWLLFIVIWGSFIDKSQETSFHPAYYWVLRNTDVCFLKLLQVRIAKEGFEKIPKEKCLFIMNHNSNFDPMIMIDAIGDAPFICVTKPENLSFPIAGPFVHHSGFIPIDRENPKNAMSSIARASEVITSGLGHVCIFPEGTRNKANGTLLPFHPGSFHIAIESHSPIVIIDLKNVKAIKKRAPFLPTKVEAKVLNVLSYNDYEGKSASEIASYCHDLILEDYTRRRR